MVMVRFLPFTIIFGFLSTGGEMRISFGSSVCWMNSLNFILIFWLWKLRDLFAGSANLIFGGRLSRLPPLGGRSSAQEEIINMPAGMHLGAISNKENRSKAISSSETVIIRDFRVFEITRIF